MKRILVGIFILGFFALSLNAQENNNEQKAAIMMKMLSLKNALLSKDSVSLTTLMVDDATYGHTTGIIQTKAQLIRDVMSGVQDYKSIEPSDINVRIYDNTGVVTLKLKVNVISGDKELNVNMNATFTWVQINGDWKLVARQSVKLPE